MTQWWFRACVLMFLLTLLQCQDRKIYVVEHWHWRASVSSVRREVHPSDARSCGDTRGMRELRRVYRKGWWCTYEEFHDTTVRVEYLEGMDRPVTPANIRVEPGETRATSAVCWLRLRDADTGTWTIIDVPCDTMAGFPVNSRWSSTTEPRAVGYLTPVGQ